MPWQTVTVNMQKKEFVRLAEQRESNVSQLCERFGISRKTGYKWLRRYESQGEAGLGEQSRRPKRSPERTDAVMEKKIVQLRLAHPAWGSRKLRRRLEDLGQQELPARSTINDILKRHDLIMPAASQKTGAWKRFERSTPNDLWQMDFKGHVPCREGRCHPLAVLDDHSRYAVVLAACADERGTTVQKVLTEAFRRYGLPWQMLMDNGAPWGDEAASPYTWLTVWLMRLGIVVLHGQPYHPQTQGKEERFNRTLKAELIGTELPWTLALCQGRFDEYRQVYNQQRPHEALNMEVPAKRYYVSPRNFPEQLPCWEYGPEDQIRKVWDGGWLSFQGKEAKVSKAFKGQQVAFRPKADQDGVYDIFFCRQPIGQLNLKSNDQQQ